MLHLPLTVLNKSVKRFCVGDSTARFRVFVLARRGLAGEESRMVNVSPELPRLFCGGEGGGELRGDACGCAIVSLESVASATTDPVSLLRLRAEWNFRIPAGESLRESDTPRNGDTALAFAAFEI